MFHRRITPSWDINTFCSDVWQLKHHLEDATFLYINMKFNICSHKLAKLSLSLVNEMFDTLPSNWVNTKYCKVV